LPHLSIEEKEGYLHATVTGSNSAENVLSYLAAVHSACAQRNCAAVLIEENLQGPGLGIASIYRVVSEASSNTRPAVRRIAYVDVNPEHVPEHMKIAETFAYNRGVNVRVFATVGEARQWLLDPPIR
jgi:hypothetical protein